MPPGPGDNLERIRRHKPPADDHRDVLDRHIIGRIVSGAGLAAGVPSVRPLFGHTLAPNPSTEAYRLESIAALLRLFLDGRRLSHAYPPPV